MTTVIFVHGTGTRLAEFDEAFAVVEKQARVHLNAATRRCYWGDHCGAVLRAKGASIPEYRDTRGDDEAASARAAWEILYKDPLFELRLMPRGAPTAFSPGTTRQTRAKQMESWLDAAPALRDKLAEENLTDSWENARLYLFGSEEFRTLVDGAAEDQPYKTAVSRALIALTTGFATNAGHPAPSGIVRDQLAAAVVTALNGDHRGLPGWVAKPFQALGQRYVENRRGRYTDGAVPRIGDILVYQLRGKRISDFIANNVRATEGPAIIIAHSLGGIAAFEMLVSERPPNVRALITVGSQAPLFYELNCLRTLEFDGEFPQPFVRWLNVFDRSDFLSYIGEGVLPGKVVDIEVDNGQPFPQSHSAYWNNDDMWTKLARALGNAVE
ncbi:hypothetical protein CBA19CS11_35815 [Caballeronia novacaledonica]|uniref:hypothetical protein n=1 Tax=Caballeronia novacaledonica TaxID=1544861 RepID=UPI001EE2F199|nr:hypothetical protein [Caballeronia novacaledonica]GJH14323.1 hypothetical protein CBA19CS11_35815 [Caballeronia novacaledonica]